MHSLHNALASSILMVATACGGSTRVADSTDADANDAIGATDTHSSVVEPPSCAAGGVGMTNCGAAMESCCTSLEVTGGTIPRTVPGTEGTLESGSVSDFRLDKYDVTVGRFRQFVGAWTAGYVPAPGSGKHASVHGGNGLENSGGDAGVEYETGWLASDDVNISPTNAALSCEVGQILEATWTDSPGGQESLPINCVNWWEAYAFCIWDGGFLPSEGEGAYAAVGGSEDRTYPWGSTPPGSGTEYSIFFCRYNGAPGRSCVSAATNLAPVGTATLGAGRWGQLDLGGEIVQWEMDHQGMQTISPCADCAYLSATESVNPEDGGVALLRLGRGGDYGNPYPGTGLNVYLPAQRYPSVGFRCARTP